MLIYRLSGTLETREADLERLWDAGALGLEERGGFVRAYFEEELPLGLDGEWLVEPDQDWQEGWKRDLTPVVAGRVTIVPPWLAAEVAEGQVPLVIEPGMAFGTGHHATTRLAVEALSALDLHGQSVLDVGTGSGVLALAALLLGAERATGVDIDPLVIPVARENAAANGLPESAASFLEGTLADLDPETPYGVLVANLFAELHEVLAEDYLRVTADGAPVILTGILAEKVPQVEAALTAAGFEDLRAVTEGEWALLTARRP